MTPPRRWSFGLRTLFVLAGAICCGLGAWIAFQLSWIRQRHEVLSRPDVTAYIAGALDHSLSKVAPGALSLFGEKACGRIYLIVVDNERAAQFASGPINDMDRSKALSAGELLEIARIQRLFPEAFATGGVFSDEEMSGASSELTREDSPAAQADRP